MRTLFLIITLACVASNVAAQIEFVQPNKAPKTELIVQQGPCDTIAIMILLENGLHEGTCIEKQYEITYCQKDPDQVGLVLQHYEDFRLNGKPVTPLAWRKKIPVAAFIRATPPIQFFHNGGYAVPNNGTTTLGLIND